MRTGILGAASVILVLLATPLILGVVVGMLETAWPANMVQAEEDYVPIMEQAENWPVIDESWDFFVYKKIHQDSNNSNRKMVSVWFVNKNNNEFEMFAKALYLKPNQTLGQSLAAMLKMEDGTWVVGDYYISMFARHNGKEAIAFRIFNRSNPHNSIAIRVFSLEDL